MVPPWQDNDPLFESDTHYAVRGYYGRRNRQYTLVQARVLNTGSQCVRAHLNQLGSDLGEIRTGCVSDREYVEDPCDDASWCPRLFLHCSELLFSDPTTSKAVRVACPLPPDLRDVLSRLEDDEELNDQLAKVGVGPELFCDYR
mmetsp:Transcript_55044/g.126410  ORF Transcript_55044/g.126410 Transcript_55044/m.126410 type:complete len:144 (-) Transcript_55044:398-829(-)